MSQSVAHLRRVAEAHAAKYPHPIRLRDGESVRVGQCDDEWPGWRWCKAPDGREGWVPDQFLVSVPEGHITRNDYDATELSVDRGDLVEVLGEEVAGWAWCRRPGGPSGWLPLRAIGMA